MTASELRLGSILYQVTADDIFEHSIIALNIRNGHIYIQSGEDDYNRIELVMEPNDTEGKSRLGDKTFYLNLDDAEIAQLYERDKKVKYAFRRMIETQEKYNELVSKFMFAEPSKPIKRCTEE